MAGSVTKQGFCVLQFTNFVDILVKIHHKMNVGSHLDINWAGVGERGARSVLERSRLSSVSSPPLRAPAPVGALPSSRPVADHVVEHLRKLELGHTGGGSVRMVEDGGGDQPSAHSSFSSWCYFDLQHTIRHAAPGLAQS